MENLMGLILGISYGYFLGIQWAKKQFLELEKIEVVDAEVIEAPVEDEFISMNILITDEYFHSRSHAKR